jgi:hypothetical protein
VGAVERELLENLLHQRLSLVEAGSIEHVEEVPGVRCNQIKCASINQQSLHSHQAAPEAQFRANDC